MNKYKQINTKKVLSFSSSLGVALREILLALCVFDTSCFLGPIHPAPHIFKSVLPYPMFSTNQNEPNFSVTEQKLNSVVVQCSIISEPCVVESSKPPTSDKLSNHHGAHKRPC